jgi:hypothetical protein
VAGIQDADEISAIQRDLLLLEQRSLDIGTDMRDAQNDPNVIRLNTHIRDQVNNRGQSFMSLNFNELYTLRDNVNHSIQNRNQLIITGSIQAGGDYARQQAELISRLGTHSTDIIARSGGIMTSVMDNLEHIFTVADMPNLTAQQLNFSPETVPYIPARYISANEPAFKIVGNTWYIAAYVPNDLIQGFAEGQSRTIYVENPVSKVYTPMATRVHQITPGTRDSRVVFRNTRYVIDFIHVRNVNIRITQRVETGLVVPNTAFTTREYFMVPLPFLHGLLEYGVLRYTAEETTETVAVTVIEWLGAQVYVAGDLRLGDVLSNGQGGKFTIDEVRTVQGVYWANHGYARFRQIETDRIITERGGTTLLCPVRNRGKLNEFDSIIVDARSVNEGDLIWSQRR